MSTQRLRELLDADWARLAAVTGHAGKRRSYLSVLTPRFTAVTLIRWSCALDRSGWTTLAKVPALVAFVVFGIEFSPKARIGAGLILPHTQGTVLGAQSIGENVTIYQQVTIGAKEADYLYDPASRPIIEDGVTLTAGVKVLGTVRVGAGSLIGANAVVVTDIPPDVVAGGIPARVLKSRLPDPLTEQS